MKNLHAKFFLKSQFCVQLNLKATVKRQLASRDNNSTLPGREHGYKLKLNKNTCRNKTNQNMHNSLLNIVQIIGCVISTMPRRGITLGPRSGATLTHSARRPERRRFFNTHTKVLSYQQHVLDRKETGELYVAGL